MKKNLLVIAIAAISLCSCSTITHTATTETVSTELYNRSSADLTVSPNKISYTFTPNDTYRRAGVGGVKKAAIAKALEANGNADVLVAPEFEIKKTRGLFTTKVKYVTVKGYPAKYTNVRPMNATEAEIVTVLGGKRHK